MTPGVVQHTFARGGAAVVRVAEAPALCDTTACMGIDVWRKGGGSTFYFRPRRGKDFMVILLRSPADARRMATFERTHSPAEVATRGRVLLVYLASSKRIAQLRDALRAVPRQ